MFLFYSVFWMVLRDINYYLILGIQMQILKILYFQDYLKNWKLLIRALKVSGFSITLNFISFEHHHRSENQKLKHVTLNSKLRNRIVWYIKIVDQIKTLVEEYACSQWHKHNIFHTNSVVSLYSQSNKAYLDVCQWLLGNLFNVVRLSLLSLK